MDGKETVPEGQRLADLRRQWRQQRLPIAPVETRAAEVGQSEKDEDHSMSLPPGNKQMEQDRASFILVHQHELAWAPFDRLSDYCESNCLHNHENRPDCESKTGH